MPTYGRPETAKDFPFNNELFDTRLKVVAVQAAADLLITPLKAKIEAMVGACDHHFVPEARALEDRSMTGIPGIFSLGMSKIVGYFSFNLECTKCHTSMRVNTNQHCPICASPTKSERNELEPAEKYFFPGIPLSHDLWSVSCTNPDCTFKAMGLRWEQE